MQNCLCFEHPKKETYQRTPKASWRRSEQGGMQGWDYQAGPKEVKPNATPRASSRSQTVIRQQHLSPITVNSKLGKNALDAENKSGFE